MSVRLGMSVRAVTKRLWNNSPIDYAQRRVSLAGSPVALTVIEYRMLVELSANAGRALTHEHLLQRVWGPDKGLDSGPVRNIVRRLRRKLGDDPGNPSYIFAEPSVGYRMAEGAETREATPRSRPMQRPSSRRESEPPALRNKKRVL